LKSGLDLDPLHVQQPGGVAPLKTINATTTSD
jgi:hypothetical protein